MTFYVPENVLGGLGRNFLATFFFILAGISDWLGWIFSEKDWDKNQSLVPSLTQSLIN